MTPRLLTGLLLIASCAVNAQFIALPGTTMGTSAQANLVIHAAGNVNLGDDNFDISKANVTVVLMGSSAGTLTHSHTTFRSTLSIDSLRMNASANYSLQGSWLVKALKLQKGKLVVNPASPNNARLVYIGSDLGTSAGSEASYVLGPMVIAGNSTSRTYPIGVNASPGYFPVQISGVTDATAFIRMECIASTPPIQLSDLTAKFEDIDGLVTDRYWTMNAYNVSNFAGAPISLSLNDQTVIDPTKNKPVVVELDTLNNATSLKNLYGAQVGAAPNLFVQSQGNTYFKGGKYMIAASKDVTVRIRRLITPNGDGENDTLFIEGLDLYPTNKVTLLDRWGGIYFAVNDFKNSDQSSIDYTKLNNGNYICVVEYTDASGKTQKPKPQMVTVLK